MAKYIESLMLNGEQYYIDTEWVSPIDIPWIYHNSDLWLISLSSDGSNWITIADKNLWATSTDITSADGYGNYYQRWNNYWFPKTWGVSTTTAKANASSYWPWNYYSSNIFIRVTSSPRTWDSTNNTNLWGWWWDENYSATQWATWLYWDNGNDRTLRQWPCDSWYHIPSLWELSMFIYHRYMLRYNTAPSVTNNQYYFSNDATKAQQFNTDFYIPVWYRSWTSSTGAVFTTYWYWQSSTSLWTQTWAIRIWQDASPTFVQAGNFFDPVDWMQIRPFKNEAVIPDDSRTKLY